MDIQTTKKRFFLLILCCFFVLAGTGIYLWTQTQTPTSFTTIKEFEVQPGMSIRAIASAAKEAGLVRSATILTYVLQYYYQTPSIFAGTYSVQPHIDVFGVAQTLGSKAPENGQIRITIPEGKRAVQIASIVQSAIPTFATSTYVQLTQTDEGYLFPDTYFVDKHITPAALITLQKNTYEKNIAPLRPEIASSSLSEYQVLILASIIEREANDETSMKMVSGILQNRLAKHMALQADASIEYVLNTELKDLTSNDLKVDSPYNTYLHTGLPPTPINNPGLMAIEAVLHPTQSKYFYYITDSKGIFHYEKTLEEHNADIKKYL